MLVGVASLPVAKQHAAKPLIPESFRALGASLQNNIAPPKTSLKCSATFACAVHVILREFRLHPTSLESFRYMKFGPGIWCNETLILLMLVQIASGSHEIWKR